MVVRWWIWCIFRNLFRFFKFSKKVSEKYAIHATRNTKLYWLSCFCGGGFAKNTPPTHHNDIAGQLIPVIRQDMTDEDWDVLNERNLEINSAMERIFNQYINGETVE